ncbi:MAG: hypothetical protein MJ166_09775 [Clostridia bacterium]|nr:hypothetical protein [Clostridia bacterium]
MKDKHFYIALIVIGLIGIIGISLLLGYTLKLKEKASIITIITTENW